MSQALWTPRHAAFKESLERLAALTPEDLRADIDLLPSEIRVALARGPLARRWSCGVCDAFGKDWYTTVDPDDSDPRWRAFAYHEVPKAGMKRVDQQHYGPLANECYVRCIATYRAAGWIGEAEEPNA